MDIAHKRIPVIEFSESISAEQRVTAIKPLIARLPNSPIHTIGHFYSGPKDKLKFSKASCIEFTSDDAAQSHLARIGGKGKECVLICGKVIAKAANTIINMERDWAIRKAEELTKAAWPARTRTIKCEFGKQRHSNQWHRGIPPVIR